MRLPKMPARRLLVATALLALLPLTGPPASAAPDPTPAAPPDAGRAGPPGTGTRVITLITGDRVHVSGQSLSIQRAPGREKARFLISQVGGDRTVTPTDAMPLLRAGRLDERLFNISYLLESGFDNSPAGLPLILRRSETGRPGAARAAVAAIPGVTVKRDLPLAKAVSVTGASGPAVWKALTAQPTNRATPAGITKVWLDSRNKLSLDVSVPLVGAPAAWQAGYDGTGVKVAILDTGADGSHPDLAGKVVAERNFTEDIPQDENGHGTHVAATAAGTGVHSAGRRRGVAPGAQIIAGKVCTGGGDCDDSAVIEGMQWAVEQGAAIVNLSLGHWDSPGVDALEQAVNDLTAQHGTLVVVAAGNLGRTPVVPISSPASADAALAIGATTKAGGMAEFSSWGPTIDRRGIKPELVAPGEDIVAAQSRFMSSQRPDRYIDFTGTSMASPHVVGAAAILKQRHPDWTADTLRAALMGGAAPMPVSARQSGAGLLNVGRSVNQSIVADPPSVYFGEHRWPHTGPAVTRTVTYTNHGTEPVTLTLSATATGLRGEAVPAAGFRPSVPTVTVPAKGTAEVGLIADSKAIGASVSGYLTGHLLATSGSIQVNTVFVLEHEEESYDLHVLHIGRDGAPPASYDDVIVRVDKPSFAWRSGFNGSRSRVARLPKGVYAVYSSTGATEDSLDTIMIEPQRVVGVNDTLVVDARKSKPVVITPPRAGLAWYGAAIGGQTDLPGVQAASLLHTPSLDQVYLGRIGPDRSFAGFRTTIRATLYEPTPDTTPDTSPGVYHLAWYVERRAVVGFTRHVKLADLATVRVSRGAKVAGGLLFSSLAPLPANSDWSVFSPLFIVPTPLQRTEYLSTEGGIRWHMTGDEITGDEPLLTQGITTPPKRYLAGRTYTERWGYAVYGPSWTDQVGRDPQISRTGDAIRVDPALGGDGEGRYGAVNPLWGRLQLYRNGVLHGIVRQLNGTFAVPPEPADYRLEAIMNRPVESGLTSTAIGIAWTFRSERPTAGTTVRLPAWSVRYNPAEVNEFGIAPAGRTVRVPVFPESQPGTDVGTLRALTVQVSFDDGTTWQDGQVVRTAQGRAVVINHPAGEGAVSLRATAEDSKGNKLIQVTIRAYRFAP